MATIISYCSYRDPSSPVPCIIQTIQAIRLCRERRRIARKRLSKRNLRKIPTKKFHRGDYPETCAICLEDFVEGEKLRVLPCRHSWLSLYFCSSALSAYHCLCIDPWLTQNRKVCPMCKRRVGAKNSDSESSDDERRRADVRLRTSCGHNRLDLTAVATAFYKSNYL